MAWIGITQRETETLRAPPGESTYEVHFSVDQSGAIPRELFLFDTSTDAFISVALVPDIESWPATKEEAVLRELDYYRAATMVRTFTVKEKAATFAADVRRRLNAVTQDYAGQVGIVFGGQQTFVYSTETP